VPPEDPVTYVLPSDVRVTPVEELDESLRTRIDAEAGDHVLTRPNTRSGSRLIGAETAQLLELFRSPRSIPAAVLEYASGRGTDPESILEDAYDSLNRLVRDRMLVPEDARSADAIEATLRPGDRVGDYEVTAVVQVLEDTELYRAESDDGDEVALKLADRTDRTAARLFRREADALRTLDGTDVAPALHDLWTEADQRILAMSWCRGETASRLSARLRGLSRTSLVHVCVRILEAYTELERHGVLHGDVNPGNVLITPSGSVVIVDYGYARHHHDSDPETAPERAGVYAFYEPEYARAMEQGTSPPPATPGGQQFSVAALLYRLLTGHNYVDFPLASDQLFETIRTAEPVPLADRGLGAADELQEVLFRALSKHRADRFASLDDLTDAFRAAAQSYPERTLRSLDDGIVEDVYNEFIDALGWDTGTVEAGLTEPPLGSVNHGAAGIAYAFYRLATLEESAELLHAADLWSTTALRLREHPMAFRSRENDFEGVSDVTPFHQPSGVSLVRCLVSRALGDTVGASRALAAYLDETSAPFQSPDLTLGHGAVLLGDAILMDVLSMGPDLEGRTALAARGRELYEALADRLDGRGPVTEVETGHYGVAHGWAGSLYALLVWSLVSGAALPDGVERRLAELRQVGVEVCGGLRWPRSPAAATDGFLAGSMAGWCHGSAGYALLYTRAYQVLGEERWLEVARRAAREAWANLGTHYTQCCGLVGRAYAQLALYRTTGDERWHNRALDLAGRLDRLEASDEYGWGLYKGRSGVALLYRALQAPARAGMPFFELEGWSPSGRGTAPGGDPARPARDGPPEPSPGTNA
jgi:serine/threonine-protein kinase